MEKLKFSPKNLLENISKLGTWSAYGLASEALQHYFPEEYDEDGYCSVSREVELMNQLGLNNWSEVIIKFHSEIGYKCEGEFFNEKAVNEY